MAYLPLGQIGHVPLWPKIFFFHHRKKKEKNWPQWRRIWIFTKLNFLATSPNTDMVDSKPFLPKDAPDPTRWANCVLHTVGEDGDEGKDEFASNLNFLTTPLWWIWIAPKSFLFYLKCPKIVGGWGSAPDPTRWPNRVLYTVGEDGDEGKNEFASNLNLLDYATVVA